MENQKENGLWEEDLMIYHAKVWSVVKDCDLTTEEGKKDFLYTILSESHSMTLNIREAYRAHTELFKKIQEVLSVNVESLKVNNDSMNQVRDNIKQLQEAVKEILKTILPPTS